MMKRILHTGTDRSVMHLAGLYLLDIYLLKLLK